MKKLFVFQRNKRIMLYDGVKAETIFNQKEYTDVFSSLETDKYGFFKNIIDHYGIEDPRQIEERFSYLFNFILVNNIVNYIIDCYKDGDYQEIIFDETIRNNSKQIIKLKGRLDTEDALGDIIISLINSESYLLDQVKIDYGKINKKEIDINFDSKKLEFFFRYATNDVKNLIDTLNSDLVAFKFVRKSRKNEEGRYILPVYVDNKSLQLKGIDNYEDFLVNWKSLAYLHMLSKIHDYFIDYYNIDSEKGLVSDDLMLGLVSLLDCAIQDYPTGLDKSIEVGRETSGKCYFIDGVVPPISITQELALILQSRDAFSVVPKVFKNKVR
ncbi:hypothetical protein [Gudongella sp. DL1XJH-153]|uniref:hypothetical protein n=1 Tax=Gudongella sp. DL1XJH-153 TaxID=3409804 RepID=UPI003BB6D64C